MASPGATFAAMLRNCAASARSRISIRRCGPPLRNRAADALISPWKIDPCRRKNRGPKWRRDTAMRIHIGAPACGCIGVSAAKLARWSRVGQLMDERADGRRRGKAPRRPRQHGSASAAHRPQDAGHADKAKPEQPALGFGRARPAEGSLSPSGRGRMYAASDQGDQRA